MSIWICVVVSLALGQGVWGNLLAQGYALMRLDEPYVGEYDVSMSYAAPSEIRWDGEGEGSLSTGEARFSYSGSVPVSTNLALRVGVGFRWLGFDVPDGAPVPENLYAIPLSLGAQWRFAERWILMGNVSPGLYSDLKDIDWGDVAVPVTVLAFYQWKRNLTLIMGFNFSYRRDVPVIPGLGVRWGFAKDWTLLLVYPVPRVEYAVTPDLTTYAGVRLIRSNYRVSETFGEQVGVPKLNNADVSYNDWRVGAGLRYRFSRLFNLTAEGGWMVGRDFEYRDEDVTVRGDGAPYVALQLTGAY